jgi:phosphoribosylamine--glycine ligase
MMDRYGAAKAASGFFLVPGASAFIAWLLIDEHLKPIALIGLAASTVGVVLASQGYPGAYETGQPISGLNNLPEATYVFHAGTLKVSDTYRTSGGRVMTVVGVADDLGMAHDLAYAAADRIQFKGMWYRHDLALRELRTPAYR